MTIESDGIIEHMAKLKEQSQPFVLATGAAEH